jgi:hypothetical protein
MIKEEKNKDNKELIKYELFFLEKLEHLKDTYSTKDTLLKKLY